MKKLYLIFILVLILLPIFADNNNKKNDSAANEDWKVGGDKETIVKFESNPSGAVVLADGKLLCQATPCSKILTQGKHEIEMQIKGNCFHNIGKQITVKNVENQYVKFDLNPRESAVKIYAQDEKDNDLNADVFVDDKKVGKAPGTFKVPLCSKKLLVKNGGIEYSNELSLKERNVLTIRATLKQPELQWSNKSSYFMGWNDAIKYCKDLNEGGHSDWRLPNIDELRTLIQNHPGTQTGGLCSISENAGKLAWSDRTDDCDGRSGSNFSKLGDNTHPLSCFWSSSSAPSTYNAWGIDFSNGGVYPSLVTGALFLRCVRKN